MNFFPQLFALAGSFTCCAKIKSNFFYVFLSVQYALHLYDYFKEWRKNPHCSFSCCLALLLPLNDLQGEVRGLVGKNVLRTQLQTGNFEMTTLRAAVKGSGAFDVTVEEGRQSDNHALHLHGDNRPIAKTSSKKCHEGTQTEYVFLRPASCADCQYVSQSKTQVNLCELNVLTSISKSDQMISSDIWNE